MKQFVALIRERRWENARWTDYFVVENSEHPEQNFRDAIQEYLQTDQGREDIRRTCEDFNWGDAMMCVPKEIWKKHHIKPVSQGDEITIVEMIEVFVDQDEVLIPQSYYECR